MTTTTGRGVAERRHPDPGLAIVNYECTRAGKVRAVCQWCGARSRPVGAAPDGRPASYELGWRTAPFPAGYVHVDGSCGSLYTCPRCCRLAGERQAAGVRPLLVPTPERIAAQSFRAAEKALP